MKNNIYKYGFYTLAIPAVLFLMYCTVYGVSERSHAFAKHLNGGMPTDVARCSMFASEHLIEVE